LAFYLRGVLSADITTEHLALAIIIDRLLMPKPSDKMIKNEGLNCLLAQPETADETRKFIARPKV